MRGRISTSPYPMYVPDFTALHAARRRTAMRKRLGCGVCMPTLLAVSTRVNRLGKKFGSLLALDTQTSQDALPSYVYSPPRFHIAG